MFEAIRQTKSVMIFLLALLVVAFVFVGVSGYTSFNQRSPAVAELTGASITQEQWDRAHSSEIDRLRQAMPQLNVKLLDSPQARYATLERLLQEAVITQATQDQHIMAGDTAVATALRQDEWLNARRDASGALNVADVEQELAARGMNSDQYAAQVAYAVAQQQLTSGVETTGVVSKAAAQATLNAYFERRDVQVARFNASDFTASVQIEQSDVQAYFDANPSQFQAPQAMDVQYVVLDQAELAKQVTVNEAELQAYYEQNKDRLAGPEERRASHILLPLDADADDATVSAATTQAQTLLAQVRGNPDTFADVAKASSKDPGSAQNGGDLGFFGKGAMVKPFEDAVFALNSNGISDVVRSDFGLHIIKLTDIKASAVKSFADMRPELERNVRTEAARKQFAEAAERFSNLVYEQADSLEPAATALGLTLQTATNVTRTNQMPSSILANPQLITPLFSAEAIDRKLNTAAIDIGGQRLVSARVVQHMPAHTKAFADVSADVKAMLVAKRSGELAREAGQAALKTWQAGGSVKTGFADKVTVSRDQGGVMAPNLVAAALRAPADTLPAYTSVDLGEQAFVVIKVLAVTARDSVEPAQSASETQQFSQAWSGAELNAYLQSLKAKYKAKILVPKPLEFAPEA
jgi:peptidyl-prolyl cis-trans isomerase D